MTKYHAILSKYVAAVDVSGVARPLVEVCSSKLVALGAMNVQATGRVLRAITFDSALSLQELKEKLGDSVLAISPIVKMSIPPDPTKKGFFGRFKK